jgi:Leucine-rich repeat (LRR) protein
LTETFLYSIDSIEIDSSRQSIDSIDITTFKGYKKLKKLFLEDNKSRQLEYGLFNHLSILRELWLEFNVIVSIDNDLYNSIQMIYKIKNHS